MDNIRDGRCGKTCRAPCPLSMGRISAASSKASSASKTPRQMFLCRKADDGCTRARSWATVILSPGASSTQRRVGASHRDGNEYLLSSILMDNVPERFSLSPKACQGILRRAEKRVHQRYGKGARYAHDADGGNACAGRNGGNGITHLSSFFAQGSFLLSS